MVAFDANQSRGFVNHVVHPRTGEIFKNEKGRVSGLTDMDVRLMKFHPRGDYFVISTAEHKVGLYGLGKNGKVEFQDMLYYAQGVEINDIIWNKSGDCLVVCTNQMYPIVLNWGNFRLKPTEFSLETGFSEESKELSGYLTCSFSEDGSRLAFLTYDRSVIIYSFSDKKLIKKFSQLLGKTSKRYWITMPEYQDFEHLPIQICYNRSHLLIPGCGDDGSNITSITPDLNAEAIFSETKFNTPYRISQSRNGKYLAVIDGDGKNANIHVFFMDSDSPIETANHRVDSAILNLEFHPREDTISYSCVNGIVDKVSDFLHENTSSFVVANLFDEELENSLEAHDPIQSDTPSPKEDHCENTPSDLNMPSSVHVSNSLDQMDNSASQTMNEGNVFAAVTVSQLRELNRADSPIDDFLDDEEEALPQDIEGIDPSPKPRRKKRAVLHSSDDENTIIQENVERSFRDSPVGSKHGTPHYGTPGAQRPLETLKEVESFQPGESIVNDGKRLLFINDVGIVKLSTPSDGDGANVHIEFHDLAKFDDVSLSVDHCHFACLSHEGVAMCSNSTLGNGKIWYHDFSQSTTLWTFELLSQEIVQSLAMYDSHVVVATKSLADDPFHPEYWIRIIQKGGNQKEIWTVEGQIVTLVGKGNFLFYAFHDNSGYYSYRLMDMSSGKSLSSGSLPLRGTVLKWVGFDENNILYIQKATGWIYMLNGDNFVPILNTSEETSDFVHVCYIQNQAIFHYKTNREVLSIFPMPHMEQFKFKPPLLNSITAKHGHDTKIMLLDIIIRQQKRLQELGVSLEETTETSRMDKELLKAFHFCRTHDMSERANDLVNFFQSKTSIKKAKEIANEENWDTVENNLERSLERDTPISPPKLPNRTRRKPKSDKKKTSEYQSNRGTSNPENQSNRGTFNPETFDPDARPKPHHTPSRPPLFSPKRSKRPLSATKVFGSPFDAIDPVKVPKKTSALAKLTEWKKPLDKKRAIVPSSEPQSSLSIQTTLSFPLEAESLTPLDSSIGGTPDFESTSRNLIVQDSFESPKTLAKKTDQVVPSSFEDSPGSTGAKENNDPTPNSPVAKRNDSPKVDSPNPKKRKRLSTDDNTNPLKRPKTNHPMIQEKQKLVLKRKIKEKLFAKDVDQEESDDELETITF